MRFCNILIWYCKVSLITVFFFSFFCVFGVEGGSFYVFITWSLKFLLNSSPSPTKNHTHTHFLGFKFELHKMYSLNWGTCVLINILNLSFRDSCNLHYFNFFPPYLSLPLFFKSLCEILKCLHFWLNLALGWFFLVFGYEWDPFPPIIFFNFFFLSWETNPHFS